MPRKSPCNQVDPKKAAWIANRAREMAAAREQARLDDEVEDLRVRQHALSELGKSGSKEWQHVTDRLLATRVEQHELRRALHLV